MSEGKKSFILYCDIIAMVNKMPNEMAGILFKHILEYVNDNDLEDPDDLLVSVAFEPIKQQLKRDLDKYKIVVNRNKENGKKGGRPKKEETQTNPENPVGYFGNPNKPRKADTDTDTDTDTVNKEKKDSSESLVSQSKTDEKKANCPQQKIIDAYHEILPMLPKVEIWHSSRKEILRTRWKENKKHQSLDFWERLFGYIAQSDFLTGKVSQQNRKPFLANLEWIITRKNFVKIIERNYEND